MTRRSTLRSLILTLIAFSIILLLASSFPQQASGVIRWAISQRPVITPPPPVIAAPRGELPAGVAGLQGWAQFKGADFKPLQTSGFLLKLGPNQAVGVVTAHGIFLADSDSALERVGLAVNGQPWPLIEADTFHGNPGTPAGDNDLTRDYALLKIDAAEPAFLLDPDPRGQPQAGERITLFSGLGDGRSAALRWEGTVQSVKPAEILVYMDAAPFNPAGMSGSPVFSQHTGKVVGMVIRGALRRSRWLLGLHPIWHLVQAAETADEFPRIEDVRR